MSTPPDGGTAFPWTYFAHNGTEFAPYEQNAGMSLRDWFASQVVGNCLDLGQRGLILDRAGPEGAAKSAYEIADAMIAARSLPHEPTNPTADNPPR